MHVNKGYSDGFKNNVASANPGYAKDAEVCQRHAQKARVHDQRVYHAPARRSGPPMTDAEAQTIAKRMCRHRSLRLSRACSCKATPRTRSPRAMPSQSKTSPPSCAGCARRTCATRRHSHDRPHRLDQRPYPPRCGDDRKRLLDTPDRQAARHQPHQHRAQAV